MVTKQCSGCKEYLPATRKYFHKGSAGFVSLCRICKSIYDLIRKRHPGKRLSYKPHTLNMDKPTRRCTNCKAVYPNTEEFFHRSTGATDQLHSKCKECYNARKRDWYGLPESKAYAKEKNARRRARRLSATPAWVDKESLLEIYRDCPKGHEVDHIIPLINNQVCGLHVPWNLQYLTKTDNRCKGNRIDGLAM